MSAGPAPPYGAAGTEPGTPTTPGAAVRAAAARSLSAATSPRELTAREEKCGAGHRRAPVEPRDGLPPSHTHTRPQHPGPQSAGTQVGEGAPYVPEEAAVADDATTPLAHRVRQGIGAEEQLSRAQRRQGAQPVSPVGGAELFHLRRLHPFASSSRQMSAASRSWLLAGSREPRACALRAHARRGAGRMRRGRRAEHAQTGARGSRAGGSGRSGSQAVLRRSLGRCRPKRLLKERKYFSPFNIFL